MKVAKKEVNVETGEKKENKEVSNPQRNEEMNE